MITVNYAILPNSIKDQVRCFSMEVLINKRYLLNREKNCLNPENSLERKRNAPLIPKNDVTKSKARLL